MLLSLNSFSQTDIRIDTMVNLRVPVAMKAAIDLVRYDEMRLRDSLQYKIIDKLEEIIKRKDEQITEQKETIVRLTTMNTLQTGIQKEVDLRYKDLERKYKKEVRAGRFKIVLLTGALAGAGYLLLK